MDKVFTKPITKQFEFDEDVAAVFDDMLERSIPFYKEVIDRSLQPKIFPSLAFQKMALCMLFKRT